jgi:dolichol-phosphate mannosyltransferase
MKYSVVIPCYNEQEVIELFIQRITAVMDGLKDNYELIFVDDGSKDATLALLRKHAQSNKKIKILALSRNFGHQAAVTAGLKYAIGDAVVVIDSDLQDPPEVIPQMVAEWNKGYKIVYGRRRKRKKETLFKKITAFVYYRLVKRLSGIDVPKDTGDFRLLDHSAVQVLNSMPEHNRYLRGMNAWIGMRQGEVLFDRDARAAGKTKYTLKKMCKLAGDGILAFSNKPLTAVFAMGFVMTTLAVMGAIAGLICHLCGIVVADIAWLACIMGFIGGLVLTAIGLVGVYIGRIYDEVKDRPTT